MTKVIADSKACSKCKEEKPLSAFYNDKSRPRGKAYQCKTCMNRKHAEFDRSEYMDVYYAANKEVMSDQSRAAMLIRKYGITAEQYAEMLFLQGGVCAICKGPGKAYGRLHVDHNHETGRIRGLLCNTCNAGLGQLRDDVELLRAAIAYLEGSSD